MIRAKTPPDHRCMGCGPKTSIAGASAATIDQMIPAYGATWQPYKERLRTVVLRNGVIAIVLGALVARLWGGLARWPLTTLLMLWPSFGGHWLEVWFLNWLRPRLYMARGVQMAARVGVWFLAGGAFAIAMRVTVIVLTGLPLAHFLAWWLAGFAFIGIELIVHLVLQLRGHPSFYNGLG